MVSKPIFLLDWQPFSVSGLCSLTLAVDRNGSEGDDQQCPVELTPLLESRLSPPLEKYQTYLVLLIGFCGFALLLSVFHNTLRKRVFGDKNSLDTTFDAGGRVTLSMTAVTVATQLLWPADLTYGATIAIRVIHARFGENVHRLYLIFSLLTNMVVSAGMLLSGRAIIQAVTADASDEMVAIVLPILFGSYTFLGGLGFVSLVMCWEVLGEAGGFLILAMGAMALMSTGSGEVIGISSILMYDIYQKYIRPFRKGCTTEYCVLCGRLRWHYSCEESEDSKSNDDMNVCTCVPVYNCVACRVDCAAVTTSYGKRYQCQTHGKYRCYQDQLIRGKNWSILGVTLFMVPFAMVLFNIGIDLTWIITAGVAFTVGFSPGVYLSVSWVKTTGSGIVAGGLSGLLAAVAVSLGLASTYDGGLSNFFKNTVEIYPSVGSCTVGFGVSLIVCVLVSLCTHKIESEADVNAEWRKTTNIGNPLRPWELAFVEEFPQVLDGFLPTHEDLTRTFKAATRLSLAGAGIGGGLMVVVLPGILIGLEVLTEFQFSTWLYFDHISTLVASVFVIFAPPIEEALKIWRQYKQCPEKVQLNRCEVSDTDADPEENMDSLL
ncbi:uncharacterized protein LOC135467460 [Liolophura sinensis]|uniref:uncharacterized protein LOC135467460 n=1 Tax=Liolophura sinensis TaxID=3198878 RepID=UPI003158DECD